MAEKEKKRPEKSTETKTPKEGTATKDEGGVRVLVDMRVPKGQTAALSLGMAQGFSTGGFQLDLPTGANYRHRF